MNYREDKMTKGYILSILLGILLFMIIFWYNTKTFSLEKFEGTSSNTTTTSIPTSTSDVLKSLEDMLKVIDSNGTLQNFSYIEDYQLIPKKDSLKIYLSTFSDKTNDDGKTDIYVPQAQKWNNYLTVEEPFLIVSPDVLPSTIKSPNGLSLKNKTLNGIRSDQLNSTDYILTSFTASFYIKINTLTFEDKNPIELFDIFVETPNYVRLYLYPIDGDDENVKIIVHVGIDSSKNEITVSKEILRSNGNKILISMVYDNDAKPSPKVHLYIGDNQYSNTITPAPKIYLGNSRIRLNGSGKLDGVLHSFMFYTSALTLDDHKNIIAYAEKQSSGILSIIEQMKKMTEQQVKVIRSYISDQTLSIEELKKKLATCKVDDKKDTEEKFKYNIGMIGTSPITAEDLKSCSVLSVKKPETTTTDASKTTTTDTSKTTTTDASKTTTTDTSTTSTAASTTEKSTLEKFLIDIPFLKNIIGKEADLSKVSKGYLTKP